MIDRKTENGGVLAIIAGGGALPVSMSESVSATGRAIFVVAIEGLADPVLHKWPHIVWKLGAAGHLFSALRDSNCTELVMIGKVPRPQFRDLHLDAGGLRFTPRLMKILIGGDGSVLDKVVAFFETEGITVKGAHEVAGDLCLTETNLGETRPDKILKQDIIFGAKMARIMGSHDVGQGVVVDKGRILAVEAAEGTDIMLSRCNDLRSEFGKGRSGVLVKVPKPGQDLRVDMPTIGVETVLQVAGAGLAGMAVERGHTLIVDRARVITAANEAGIFISTVAPQKA
jgi:UDP-2,3-diacylglucosamine hydrolase